MAFKRAPDAVTVLMDQEVMAVLQGGRVEVWNAEGTLHYGNLPEKSTASDVKRVMAFHAVGYKAGYDLGVAHVRHAIQVALGLTPPAS